MKVLVTCKKKNKSMKQNQHSVFLLISLPFSAILLSLLHLFQRKKEITCNKNASKSLSSECLCIHEPPAVTKEQKPFPFPHVHKWATSVRYCAETETRVVLVPASVVLRLNVENFPSSVWLKDMDGLRSNCAAASTKLTVCFVDTPALCNTLFVVVDSAKETAVVSCKREVYTRTLSSANLHI